MPPPPGYRGYGAYGGGPYGGYGAYGGGPYGGYGAYGGGPYGGYGRPQAPKPGIIPLRPLTVGEILDGAFTAIRWNPRTILVSSAAVATISGVLLTVVTLVVQRDVFANVSLPQNGATLTSAQVGNFLTEILALLGVTLAFTFVTNTILTGVLTVAYGQAVLGRKETLGGAWRVTRSRIWPMFGTVLAKGLFLGLGWLAAVVLLILIAALFAAAHLVAVGILIGVIGGLAATVFAVIVDVRWAVAMPVLMLERTGPLKSLGRSWRLVRNSAWRVFGIILLADLIVGIAGEIIRVPFTLAGGGTGLFTASQAHPSVVGEIVSAIGAILATTVTAPMAAGIIVLLYADLRMRREGMDIALQAAAAPAGGQGTAGGGPGSAGPPVQNPGPW